MAVRGDEGNVLAQDGGSNRTENLHNKVLLDFYYPRNIIWVIKLWKMRWEGCVACA